MPIQHHKLKYLILPLGGGAIYSIKTTIYQTKKPLGKDVAQALDHSIYWGTVGHIAYFKS
jgi:hypothetical protein